MLIKIDTNTWINHEMIDMVGLHREGEDEGPGDDVETHTDVVTPAGVFKSNLDPEFLVRMVHAADNGQEQGEETTSDETARDELSSSYFEKGWQAALEEAYRRIAQVWTGEMTREQAVSLLREYLTEQIGEERIAMVDGEWSEKLRKIRDDAVTARELWPDEGDSTDEVPVVKVAEPTTAPDAVLRRVSTGEKVDNLTMARGDLDSLVTQANNGSNISNYAMARRVMELLGVELTA